ncbi:hypothetical protein F7P69_07860 [Cellulosimicrobium funkei]|nr:hypothetical protein [Cellulosimicrobium funkei]
MSRDDLLGALDGTNPPVPPPSAPGGRPSSGPGATDQQVCSRKGCGNPAAWRLEWNNPRIHTPDRRKTWLACEDHRGWLADYLQSRGLLRDVLPLASNGTDTREKDS